MNDYFPRTHGIIMAHADDACRARTLHTLQRYTANAIIGKIPSPLGKIL